MVIFVNFTLGFQIPFAKRKDVKVETVVSDDPFAMIKQAKTREERKELFKQMTEARRNKNVKKKEDAEADPE